MNSFIGNVKQDFEEIASNLLNFTSENPVNDTLPPINLQEDFKDLVKEI